MAAKGVEKTKLRKDLDKKSKERVEIQTRIGHLRRILVEFSSTRGGSGEEEEEGKEEEEELEEDA